MTYDPGRGARTPAGASPNRRLYEREGTSLSVALMLVLMAAFIAVGFWFYATRDNATVAMSERSKGERSMGERFAAGQTTTASGAQEPPLPKTPTPPTVPSPSTR